MKKALTLGLFLLAAVAAAGTYTITTSTAQDTRLERHRVRVNKATCTAAGLPANCTQAQARVTNPGVNIYSSVQDMIDRLVLQDFLNALRLADTADDSTQFCAWFNAASTANKNSACALAGLPNGCELCN